MSWTTNLSHTVVAPHVLNRITDMVVQIPTVITDETSIVADGKILMVPESTTTTEVSIQPYFFANNGEISRTDEKNSKTVLTPLEFLQEVLSKSNYPPVNCFVNVTNVNGEKDVVMAGLDDYVGMFNAPTDHLLSTFLVQLVRTHQQVTQTTHPSKNRLKFYREKHFPDKNA